MRGIVQSKFKMGLFKSSKKKEKKLDKRLLEMYNEGIVLKIGGEINKFEKKEEKNE